MSHSLEAVRALTTEPDHAKATARLIPPAQPLSAPTLANTPVWTSNQ